MEFKVVLSDPAAVIPSKAHPTDAGYDLTAIKIVKRVGDVTFYGTGVHISPPAGYYFLLYPRSSITKTGFSLANSVGVIDADYQGEIIIALRTHGGPELTLPSRVAQLVPAKIHELSAVVVKSFESTTQRGEGGFGSTGN